MNSTGATMRRFMGIGLAVGLAAAWGAAMGAPSHWITDGAGDWSDGANWSPAGSPNGPGAEAWLDYDISDARTVTLDVDATVGTLVLADDVSAYSLAGAQTLEFDATNGIALAVASNVSHYIDANLALTDTVEFRVTGLYKVLNLSRSTGSGGVISGDGGIVKSGIGTLKVCDSINRANTYTGPTIVRNGCLDVVGYAAANGEYTSSIYNEALGAATTPIELGDAGTPSDAVIWLRFFLDGKVSLHDMKFNRAINVNTNAATVYFYSRQSNSKVFLEGAILLRRTLTLYAAGSNYGVNTIVVSGKITEDVAGAGALVVTGTEPTTSDPCMNHPFILTAANTYSGGTSFNSASLAIGANNVLGTGPITFNGGCLVVAGPSAYGLRSVTNAVVLAAGGARFGGTVGGYTARDLALTYTGSVALPSAQTPITQRAARTTTFHPGLAGAGKGLALSFQNTAGTAAGTFVLAGTNTYDGRTTVSGSPDSENGTLTVNGSLASGDMEIKTYATVNGSGTIAFTPGDRIVVQANSRLDASTLAFDLTALPGTAATLVDYTANPATGFTGPATLRDLLNPASRAAGWNEVEAVDGQLIARRRLGTALIVR